MMPRIQQRQACAGFTLLEMVITIGIFAMMYVLVVAFLGNVLDGRDQLNRGAAKLEQSQRAMTFLTLDFEQMIARPVRDSFGDYQPALVGEDQQVSFTRLGWSNPFSLRDRSDMQRVIYALEEGTLYRRYWPVLDVAAGTEWREDVLLDGVDRFTVRYLQRDDAGEWLWLELWPDARQALQPVWQQPLPKSVEVEIELENGEVLHRFFRVVVNPWA